MFAEKLKFALNDTTSMLDHCGTTESTKFEPRSVKFGSRNRDFNAAEPVEGRYYDRRIFVKIDETRSAEDWQSFATAKGMTDQRFLPEILRSFSDPTTTTVNTIVGKNISTKETADGVTEQTIKVQSPSRLYKNSTSSPCKQLTTNTLPPCAVSESSQSFNEFSNRKNSMRINDDELNATFFQLMNLEFGRMSDDHQRLFKQKECDSEDEHSHFPLYPEFNDKTAESNAEIIQDWISILLKENRSRIDNVDDTFLLFVDSRSVEYLFTICLRMRLPHDVKFMTAHVASLYGMIIEMSDRTNEQKAKEWEKSLSTRRVRRCLQLLGLAYTEDAVRRSELRILMTLDFCSTLRHTPVVYVESVLAILNKLYRDLNPAKLWEYSLLFLDCVYLKMDEVYQRILTVIHGRNAINLPKDRMRRLQADYMLLAVGVIATACVCLYGMEFGDKAVELLAKISRISTTDILDVSTGIMKTVLDYGAVVSSAGMSSSGLPATTAIHTTARATDAEKSRVLAANS